MSEDTKNAALSKLMVKDLRLLPLLGDEAFQVRVFIGIFFRKMGKIIYTYITLYIYYIYACRLRRSGTSRQAALNLAVPSRAPPTGTEFVTLSTLSNKPEIGQLEVEIRGRKGGGGRRRKCAK